MKNSVSALLCLSVLLTACDSSKDTVGDLDTSEQDKADSLTSNTTSVIGDVAEKASDELDSALESAKNAADSLAESAHESAVDAAGAAGDLKDAAIESAEAGVEKANEMIASVSTEDTSTGESIYKSSCIACHGSGVAGAPKLGDQAAWNMRIAQGNAVLSQHAIEGYKGETGYMPPKGGSMKLSDDEVSLAVQYMVSQVQ